MQSGRARIRMRGQEEGGKEKGGRIPSIFNHHLPPPPLLSPTFATLMLSPSSFTPYSPPLLFMLNICVRASASAMRGGFLLGQKEDMFVLLLIIQGNLVGQSHFVLMIKHFLNNIYQGNRLLLKFSSSGGFFHGQTKAILWNLFNF